MDNPAALRRWMVAGPVVARIVTEFEGGLGTAVKGHHHHHEQQVQTKIFDCSLWRTRQSLWKRESRTHCIGHWRDVDDSVMESVEKIERICEEQFNLYVTDRLVDRKIPVTDILTKNKLPLFSRQPVKTPSRQSRQMESLKNECYLFSRLYISCQTRAHENQPAPPL